MKINMTISDNDPMYAGNETMYKKVGLAGLKCVQNAVMSAFKKDDDINNILDFACGYGRVMRALQAGYPKATITACDIMSDAIKFCADTFDAIAIQGNENIDLIDLPAKYDVIWVGPLFTHLPIERWATFLNFFRDNLSKDGVLVFTLHGRTALYMMEKYNLLSKDITNIMFKSFQEKYFTEGYAFFDYSIKHKDALAKIGASHSRAFGLSFTRPDYVCKYLLELNAFRILSYSEGAWAHNHDVVTLSLTSQAVMDISKKRTIVKKEIGFCPCCDNETEFISEHEWLRDNYRCMSCNSIPRERHLSYVIEQILPNWKDLFIHESSPSNRGTSKKLKKYCKNYIASQYYAYSDEKEINGFKNIDLQKQTFDNEVFDLVVTQDVFEHLPYPELAIKEVARTLKKGGYFISTIPLVNRYKPTIKWAELVDEELNFLYAPEYHGNPIDSKGSPVFWHYGYDIASKFIEYSGMETIIIDNTLPKFGIEAELLEVIICKKI